MTNNIITGVDQTSSNSTDAYNLTNTGDSLLITSTGQLFALGFDNSNGLGISALDANVIDDGFIYSAEGAGILASAAGLTLFVNGEVQGLNGLELTGASASATIGVEGQVFGYGTAVVIGGESAVFTNDGTINSGSGEAFDTQGAGIRITNDGLISVPGGTAFELDGGGEFIVNTGKIVGGLSVSDNSGITVENSGTWIVGHGGIDMLGTLTNTGTIHGNISFDSAGSSAFSNGGTIHGNVALGTGETFANSGLIDGNVSAEGSDTFNFNHGRITGTVTDSGNGHDLFEFKGAFGEYTIAGFLPAGASHDTIHFAADDFVSFAQLQSHMTQVQAGAKSFDTVISLDATDTIILVGVKMASLAAHDFSFG